jgi:hypothetical protein
VDRVGDIDEPAVVGVARVTAGDREGAEEERPQGVDRVREVDDAAAVAVAAAEHVGVAASHVDVEGVDDREKFRSDLDHEGHGRRRAVVDEYEGFAVRGGDELAAAACVEKADVGEGVRGDLERLVFTDRDFEPVGRAGGYDETIVGAGVDRGRRRAVVV